MAAAPCKECRRRPKMPRRHRCVTCQLRHEPIGEQVAAAQRRLAMIPEEMRLKRSKKIEAQAPTGTSWCAGCQSFRDVVDFGKSATQCRACSSAKSHAAMIEKNAHAVSGAIRSAMVRAGIQGKPHQLRHFYGTELVRAGVNLRIVQTLMRHESPATTAIYTDVNQEQQRAGIAALQWPAPARAA